MEQNNKTPGALVQQEPARKFAAEKAKMFSQKLVEMNPIYCFYWQELFGLDKPDLQNTEVAWVVSFEQATRPGHYFEICVDSSTGEVVGGSQRR